MSIVYHDNWEVQKGTKDAERHQRKIDKAIRENVRGVIGQENIITGKKGKVKVAVRGLKDYRFIYGGGKGSGGIGQGEKKPGDVIHQEPIGQGQGGESQGIFDMKAEVDIEYLLDIMFEDLGLPYLDPKKKNSIEITKGWKVNTVSKKGVYARLHKKRTMKETIKRTIALVYEIMEETSCTEDVANRALVQSMGDINEAIDIINEDRLTEDEINFIVDDEDFRFNQIEEDTEICSKAVVIAMMDVSGSMTIDKKYLCKSLLFWLVMFLRKQYDFVEIRFVRHTDVAEEVDEDTFFYGDATGGTYCHTAYDKAKEMIENEYPLEEWNVYAIHCSDGDDFNTDKTIESVEELLKLGINMISYIEIKPYDDPDDGPLAPFFGMYAQLIDVFKTHWDFEKVELTKEGRFFINHKKHFLLSLIKDKSHIWLCLKHMLGINSEIERVE